MESTKGYLYKQISYDTNIQFSHLHYFRQTYIDINVNFFQKLPKCVI